MRALLVILAMFLSCQTWAKSMIARVELNPMGSFEVKTKRIRGSVMKKADRLEAVNIEIPVRSFETDNETRDNHLKEKLNMKKFPNVVVQKAIGKGGRGQAIIQMSGATQKVPFSYEEKGSEVQINFNISLKSFGISGINYMGVGVEDGVKIKATLPLK